MNLYAWALRHNIPGEAIDDLRQIMGMDPGINLPFADSNPTTEEGVQKLIRLSEAGKGNALWRNNVGAMQGDDGRVIRYGLANESKQMNQRVKSSDLIGITKVTVEPWMVGKPIGVFTAIETKRPTWRYTGTDREQAQLKFMEIVISMGGIAYFSTGVES